MNVKLINISRFLKQRYKKVGGATLGRRHYLVGEGGYQRE